MSLLLQFINKVWTSLRLCSDVSPQIQFIARVVDRPLVQQGMVRCLVYVVMSGVFDAFCVIFRAPPATQGVERQFFELSSAHNCECSRAPAGLPIHDYGAVVVHTFVNSSEQQQQKEQFNHSTTIIQSGEAPFSQAGSLHTTLGS